MLAVQAKPLPMCVLLCLLAVSYTFDMPFTFAGAGAAPAGGNPTPTLARASSMQTPTGDVTYIQLSVLTERLGTAENTIAELQV